MEHQTYCQMGTCRIIFYLVCFFSVATVILLLKKTEVWTAFHNDYKMTRLTTRSVNKVDQASQKVFENGTVSGCSPYRPCRSSDLTSSSNFSNIRGKGASGDTEDAIPKIRDFRNCFDMVINHKKACDNDSGSSLPLLVIVISGANKFSARDAVRRTWGGSFLSSGAQVLFLLGKPGRPKLQQKIELENSIHNDIIQANFIDSYRNLTLKVVSMMKWTIDYCRNVSFVLKADDDMLINVNNTLDFVTRIRGNITKSIIGMLFRDRAPIINPKSKYFMPKKVYPKDRYPDFAQGAAYIYTGDSAAVLYKASLDHRYMHLEDVLITGIVAEEVSVRRLDEPRMQNIGLKFDYCSFHDVISLHDYTPKEMIFLWKLSQTSRLCPKSFFTNFIQKIFPTYSKTFH